MRIIKVFFSFYMLLLTVLPCVDVHSAEDEMPATMEQAADRHEHDKDVCPPFCICSCCGTSVTNVFFFSAFSAIFPVASQDFPVYHSPFIPEVYFNIWQPPKVG